jgi:hypothetical protein
MNTANAQRLLRPTDFYEGRSSVSVHQGPLRVYFSVAAILPRRVTPTCPYLPTFLAISSGSWSSFKLSSGSRVVRQNLLGGEEENTGEPSFDVLRRLLSNVPIERSIPARKLH